MAMDPSMMDDAPVMQGPAPEPKSLQQRVVSMLKENLSIPHNHPIDVRQAPLQDGEDHDNWTSSDDEGAFDNLANELIEMIQGGNQDNDSEQGEY